MTWPLTSLRVAYTERFIGQGRSQRDGAGGRRLRQALDAEAVHPCAFSGGVQVVGVALMVLAVVDLHGPLVDVRLKGVVGVGEVGEGEGHESDC